MTTAAVKQKVTLAVKWQPLRVTVNVRTLFFPHYGQRKGLAERDSDETRNVLSVDGASAVAGGWGGGAAPGLVCAEWNNPATRRL